MSGYYYPNGLSSKATAPAILKGPIYTSVPVLYVDSVNGSTGFDGTNTRPLPAITNANTAGGLVVLKSGHTETFTSALTPADGITIVGEETSGGVPTASLLNNQAGGDMFTLSANTNVEFRNILFPPQVQSCSTNRINWTTAGQRFRDCTLRDDVNDQADMVRANGSFGYFSGCTFEAAGTSTATTPEQSALTFICVVGRVRNCTFDDGAFGRDDPAASFSNDSAKAENVVLLRGAQVTGGTSAQGYATLGTATGGGVFVTDDHFAYPNGVLGSTAGDTLLTEPLVTMTRLYWVDSATGDDSNTGLKETPYATLAACISAITSGAVTDAIVVLVDGHTETLTANMNVGSAGTTIVGAGTATLTMPSDADGITLSADGCELRNVNIVVTADATYAGVTLSGDCCSVTDCDFTTAVAVYRQLYVSGAQAIVEGSTFGTTSTTLAMAGGLVAVSANGLVVENCTFDSGTLESDLDSGLLFVNNCIPVRAEGIVANGKSRLYIASTCKGYAQVTADANCSLEFF